MGVGVAGKQQERARAPLGESLEEREHVRAVLRGRRRPRRGQLRAKELVLRQQRVVAARGGNGGVEELVRARLDRRRVGRLRRRADAVVHVEVEVDGLRAPGPQLRRNQEVRRRSDDPRPGEDRRPERDHPVGVVDPERLHLRQPAGQGQRCRRPAATGDAGGDREQRDAENEDPSHERRCSKDPRGV